jgi:hypothetical protein
MKTKCLIVFVIGGKGGVGKSWLVGLLVQWLELLGVVFGLFDCDDETSTTTRFFPAAQFLAIRSSAEIDRIVQLAAEGKYAVIVVDLPARAGDEFQQWFSIVPWQELAEIGVRFTAVGVISGSKDSIECVLNWQEFLGDHVGYVIALNRRDKLDIYESSRARQQFQAAGYPEIEIPKLDEKFAAALDKSNWTINQALTATEPHLLTQLMSRARLRRYRDEIFVQFNKVKTYLLP